MSKFVTHPLFHNPTEIKAALNGVASQEQNDGPDYDLMVDAAKYIAKLETKNHIFAMRLKRDNMFQAKCRILSDKML